jgi:outer membrane murein-binding lipoprotein Lpp
VLAWLAYWRGILTTVAAVLLLILQLIQVVLSSDIVASLGAKTDKLAQLVNGNGAKLDQLESQLQALEKK